MDETEMKKKDEETKRKRITDVEDGRIMTVV